MTTRRQVVSLSIVLPVLAAACGASPTAPAPSVQRVLRDSLEMAPGDRVYVEPLRLSFFSVTDDSRCPIDGVCFWEGDAAVHIGLAIGSGPSLPETLHTAGGGSWVDFHGIRITLIRLLPDPLAGVPIAPEDYRASFRVESLPDST